MHAAPPRASYFTDFLFRNRVLFLLWMNEKPVPEGFQYSEEIISEAEENHLVRFAEGLSYVPYVMRGVASKRRIYMFGADYSTAERLNMKVEPLPDLLIELRDKAADVAGISRNEFDSALVSRYPAGAGIGWHRDLPVFGPVVLGISLHAPCKFKIRHAEDHQIALNITLAPRSMYVLSGTVRSEWEHSIPPVKLTRYSITFRSKKSKH